MRLIEIVVLCCVLMLTACGSGASQAGDAGLGTLMATRDVPGGGMSLYAMDAVAAGETVRFQLRLKDLPDPEKVTVHVGDSYVLENVSLEAQSLADHTWEITLVLPPELSHLG